MSPSRSSPDLWIVSSKDALHPIDRRLAHHGIKARRLVTLDFHDVAPRNLRAALRDWGSYDTLVVTSLHAVSAFVRPVLSSAMRRRPDLEAWAAGTSTARALKTLGFQRVRRAEEQGARAIIRDLSRETHRSVVYPRSDLAGRTLADRLRRQGHRVLDLVAYRTVTVALSARERNRLLRPGQTLVVTSPSALSALRRSLSPSTFRTLREGTRIIALGARTQRSARGHGFRNVDRPRSPSVEGLTAYLVREVRHAPK